MLNYWRSSHYGGAFVNVAKGEQWTKVVGPFFLYCNNGGDAKTLWDDACAMADTKARLWPYYWVNGVDYPHRDQRSDVSGRFVIDDPVAPDGNFPAS